MTAQKGGHFPSDHLEILQRLPDGFFLLRRAFGLAAVFGLGLVVVRSFLDAALLLDLRNIEVAHVQSRMLLDIFPDFLIGSFRFHSGHVQFIHLQIDRDLLVDIQFGQSTYRLNMG